MSGWFYLGTSARDNHHHLSKDESHGGTGGGKGFELWPQLYGHPEVAAATNENHFAGGSEDSGGRRVNLIDFSDECWRSGVTSAMRPSGGGGGGAGTNCQDCGNQAKKDCTHMRCRTCCKSRGFQCQTHLKSTWVPAAKRRERQQQQQLAGMQQPFRILENPKRPREEHNHPHHHQQQQPLVTPRSSGLEVGQHFPPEVNSPAVFRCVRVTGVDDADEELAYQTSVNIAGHVFKGILYDLGPEESSGGGGGGGGRYSAVGGESSGAGQHQQQFSLTTGNPQTPLIDPSLFPAPMNAFMAGTQFFPPPRS